MPQIPGNRRYPALSRPAKGMRVEVVQQDRQTVDGLSEADVALLTRRAACGCLSLVCRAADGRGFPFVLQPMRIRRIALPASPRRYRSFNEGPATKSITPRCRRRQEPLGSKLGTQV